MKTDSVILIVESDSSCAEPLTALFEKNGWKTVCTETIGRALELLDKKRFDLIICRFENDAGKTGLDLLAEIKRLYHDVPVILTSSEPSIESCKESLRRGAYDYLVKPIEDEKIISLVRQALGTAAATGRAVQDFIFPGILSRSPAMQGILRVLRRVSRTDLSILIEGESGTGKELTARAICENSPRKDKPFFPINCAGLSETLLESELFGHVKGAFTGAVCDRKGLFALADKGTLFLDEIGDMPLTMQAKLLRVLEDGHVLPVGASGPVVVDVRVISATNHDLTSLVEQKKFRQDLYFRIREVSITLPPLRSRPADIPELFGYFLKEACREIGRDIHLITEPAMRAMMSYSWPGNTRQLKNTVRMMVVMCDHDTLDLRDLPPEIARVRSLEAPAGAQLLMPEDITARSLEEVEREHLCRVLEITGQNRTEAAKILKIGERTLYRKIKEYGL